MNKVRRYRLTSDEEKNLFEFRKNKGTVKDDLLERIKQKIKNNSFSVEELSNIYNVPPKKIRECLDQLKQNKFNIDNVEDKVFINTSLREGGKHILDSKMWQGDTVKFGFTSDQHLCSNYAREDVLNLLYDIYANEGIPIVLNSGNWIDGEARFNKNDIFIHGMSKQIEYAVDKYPYRNGVTTWFIAGDDHEGWFSQREGVNIGEYLQLKREQAGKNDLKYLGYMEADIDLNEGKYENQQFIRLIHPGGGSAYAVSYAPQKLIESLQGGEKPAGLFVGHYHKLSYNIIRNVHTIQCGTTEDQSLFMRKQKIEAHVGGGIVEFRRDKYGIINRCKVDFITAFDRKFYIGKDKYWK